MPAEKVCLKVDGQPWYDDLPASVAVKAGELLFVSGQISVDEQREPTNPGDVAAQARQAFENLRDVLEAAGGTLDDIVDIMSFHKDIRDLDTVFDVAREFLDGDYPAWTPAAMLGSYSPRIELSIRAIAHLGDEPKQCFTPDTLKWWRDLPASPGCKKGSLLFISGQYGTDADGYVNTPGDHGGQTRNALNRVREICEMAGGGFHDVIDFCSFHQDARGMEACSDVYEADFFEGVPLSDIPAWTAIGTPALQRIGMLCSYRAIVDLSPGARIAKTPASLWWKNLHLSGVTKKQGGRLVGIAGQVASDGDGNITTPGDTAAQARYAFNRIKEGLEMLGGSLDDVVEITSFHKDPRAWEIVMGVAPEFFDMDNPPAWTPAAMTGLWQQGYLHEIYAAAVID